MIQTKNSPQMPAKVRLAELISSFFYVGFLPKMPGTWGSIAALPFAWFLWQLDNWLACLLIAIMTGISIWAAKVYCEYTRTQDNQKIVSDEVIGIWITASVAEHNFGAYLLVFLCFRCFDIWKPWPVDWIDQKIHGGLGVILDDVAAGFWAALAILFFTSGAIDWLLLYGASIFALIPAEILVWD